MKEVKIKVLLVCLGNICRSPTAEGVLRKRIETAGWGRLFEIDSAGTAAYHIGEPPDLRSQQHARQRGYDISRLRGRQLQSSDLHNFDYVLAMDSSNLADIRRLEKITPDARAEIGLFLDYCPEHYGENVPDPYYGGPGGFETVLDLAEAASDGFIKTVLKKQGLLGCGC